MPYRYLEDIAIADVAYEASGETLEELFIAAGDALMNVMVADLATIHRAQELIIRVEHPELDLLLFNFLNELVFYKDARRLLLLVESVAIDRHDGTFALRAKAGGEELDPRKHHLLADVKAVTLHRFRVEQTEKGWEATVVVDV